MFKKIALKASQNAPQLWFIAGGVFLIASVKCAWDAAPRYKEIVDEYNGEMAEYNLAIEIADSKDDPESVYPLAKRKADKRGISIRTAGKHTANMMKVAVCVGLTLICFAKGYGVLNGWYTGAMALFLKKSKELKHLEDATEAKYGKEVLSELKGPGFEETPVTSVDPETGETKTIGSKKDIYETYALFFDESNPNWTKNPVWNKRFLLQKQNQLNSELHTKGYVYLNRVLEILEMPLCEEGQLVGWVEYDDPVAAKAAGASNCIDFGIFDDNERAKAFVSGDERSILLHFNVDAEPIIKKTGYLALSKLK